jgi:hypothetical protein
MGGTDGRSGGALPAGAKESSVGWNRTIAKPRSEPCPGREAYASPAGTDADLDFGPDDARPASMLVPCGDISSLEWNGRWFDGAGQQWRSEVPLPGIAVFGRGKGLGGSRSTGKMCLSQRAGYRSKTEITRIKKFIADRRQRLPK